ncbi:riboflavin biosynthesis protein RibD [Bradyrhizobium sp. SSBR45G]|uniref:dihydrofolate reductase family protein n=1 Tax=unclassified Bradyrhizobium TaxID=2631580 RepID=UPI002342A349|nr:MULTISPECIES: dihydrofolate reductase family protein [unclassified Bradyrhizobium]GLH81640.1 riboflavin biosynthesis protein RibD [Bradyrhizobium sp. SSBR45G]GLH89062.1 riboflavin biosynthesis protein RibD [Bradyrhizobium sp. SSBR45R]
MARLVLWNMMTLDGMVAGENGDISWHEDVWGDELERFSEAQLHEAGGLVFGRVTYDLMAGYWRGASGVIAEFMNSIPKHVASRTLSRLEWSNAHLLGPQLAVDVDRLKTDSPKDLFLFGSADLASTLIAHDLIDEFRLAINPRMLGRGVPLFKPGQAMKLRLIDSRPLSNGVVIVRYMRVRDV